MIYLDNAATTPVSEEVWEAMHPYFTELYGNPSSGYQFAGKAKKAVEHARTIIADGLHALPEEIYFTSGGSESDNWALQSAADAYADKGKHIITSKIEHHAILRTAEALERKGYEVTYLDVDANGQINLEQLQNAIRDDTILVSVMTANNEIGTIQPIETIGRLAHERGVLFHTDAVQAFGHIPIDVARQNIDLLSASSHKLNGPKGVGFLYIKKGTRVSPLIYGGSQEKSRRAGTYNVPGIVGLGKASEIAFREIDKRLRYELDLRNYLIDRVLSEIPYSQLNGDQVNRLPNNANFSFRFIEGESLLILLDQNGICASSGSACTSASLEASHVLLAIGLPHEIAHGSLRLTLSHLTTREDIDQTVDAVKKSVERLREMSPLYEEYLQGERGKE